MSLADLDKDYRSSIQNSFVQLQQSYNNILSNYKFDLAKKEITEAILERLKSYYSTQNAIKNFLNKRYITAGADYFVETTLFFLNLYFQTLGENYQAHSERQIRQKRGSIRPDISVWKGNEVVATIECKTQLGWNRNSWEEDYKNRETILKREYLNANSYLLVMTGSNWGGFGVHPLLGKKYFCLLCDIWPIEYTQNDQIFTPIEGLFKQLSFTE